MNKLTRRLLAIGLPLIAIVAVAWGTRAVGRRPVPVRIESTPARAAAYLDGKYVGQTPVEIADVGWGPHTLRLERKGSAPHRSALAASEILRSPWDRWATQARGQKIVLRLRLRDVASGALVVTSDPSGASVSVDGKREGQTPLRLDHVRPGERVVRVMMKGYEDAAARPRVDAGKEATVHARLTARILAILEGRVKEEPTNLHHQEDLAHEYLLRGRHKEAVEWLHKGHKLALGGKATAGFEDDRLVRRFYYECSQIVTRDFRYPEKGAKPLRKAAYKILREGADAFPDDRSIQAYLKQADRYKNDHGD